MSEERAERRLAAVLAADVVGYSRLIGLDETGTRTRFNMALAKVIQPALDAHSGRLVKTLGDGVLAEFSSVVDAVACAMDIQKKTPSLHAPEGQEIIFRIGVNLGDIIVEGDDIHGDGVNVAARLEALAPPGGICISRAARDQVRDRMDITLTDLGEVEVKNIARPVRVFSIGEAAAKPATVRSRKPLVAAVFATLGLLVVAGYIGWNAINAPETAKVENMAFPLPDRPSLAVLPFRVSGDDEAASVLAEALALDVTSKLAQVSGLFVISSAATLAYADRTVSPKIVAEELGVRNIVTGAVRETVEGFGVAVDIVDAISGQAIFSGDFKGGEQSLFELQEDISAAIARELAANLTRTAVDARTTASPEAYLLWYRGSRYFAVAPTPDTMSAARALAQQAIALDPEFGRAHALLAYARTQEGYFKFVENWQEAVQDGLDLSKTALAIAPDDWYATEVRAYATMNVRRYEEALEYFDKAINLAPAQTSILVGSTLPLLFLGRADEALKRVKTARRLNPFHDWNVPQFQGMALFMKQDYDAALEQLETSGRLNPNFIGNLLWRAATYGQLGDDKKAAEAVDAILKINPKASISRGFIQIKNAEIQARFEEGLRKAGLPE